MSRELNLEMYDPNAARSQLNGLFTIRRECRQPSLLFDSTLLIHWPQPTTAKPDYDQLWSNCRSLILQKGYTVYGSSPHNDSLCQPTTEPATVGSPLDPYPFAFISRDVSKTLGILGGQVKSGFNSD